MYLLVKATFDQGLLLTGIKLVENRSVILHKLTKKCYHYNFDDEIAETIPSYEKKRYILFLF